MPFSGRTHKSTSHKLFVPTGTVTVRSSSNYKKPLKPRVLIYNNTGTEVLYDYNAFFPENNTDALLGTNQFHALTALSVTIGKNKNSFTFSILDENITWNRKLISEGNIVRILTGKTSASSFLAKGYIKKMRPHHIGNGKRIFTFEGIGEKAEFTNILVTYQRAATSVQFDTEFNIPRRPDSQMAVYLLVKDILETNGIRVTSRRSVKDHLNLDTSGISTEVDIRILSVSFINVELSTVMDFFCEITGATWDIRDGKFIFEYAKQKHSGITVKARANLSNQDLADSTAYFTGDNGWEYTESIDKSDGYMTHATVQTIIATKSVASSAESGGSKFNLSTLYKTWLAQQFTALDARFITVKLVLSRIGDPTGGINDPEHPVLCTGQIVTDNNNSPTGAVIAEFDIPYTGLTSDPTDVFINDIHVDPANASPNTKYWLRIKPIGFSRGDSIRWHHDNNVSIEGRYSAFATGEETDPAPSWRVSSRGPTYNFTVFAKIQRLQFFGDQAAADRYNQTDSALDVTYLEDVETVSKLAQMELAIRSNPVRIYDAQEVTIPNNKLFLPAEQITIVDPVLGIDENENVVATMEEITYDYNAEDDLGMRYVKLNVMGEYLYKIEDLPS